ncbi:MAG TPA: enoyl-CoA hydratase-related protein [Syntrophales bacterium]|nr:enoyl-CoA hydratase-related protein [Syntrophales bacterium]
MRGYSDFSTMRCETPREGVLAVTLNRPAQLNAINPGMIDEFDGLFDCLEKDPQIRVVILTGEGRGFCSGADLSAAAEFRDSKAFAEPESFLRLVQERYAALPLGLRRIPQPVIAAINGPAVGGGLALALASDVRFASPEAYFVASFINIGLSAGELGTSYLLPRLVGLSRAAEILYTGRKVHAEEAERIGLVNRVVAREKLMEDALALAGAMLGKNAGGLQLTKRVLDRNLGAPSLEAAVELENRNQTMLVFSGDFFRLIQAFAKGNEKQ